MILTETEMTRLWLLRKGYEPLRSDCRIERSDGADLLALARGECRLWYERLLLTAPAGMLVLHDISKSNDLRISMTITGSVMVQLPEECVRPITVKLSSWLSPAEIVPAGHPRALRQYTRYAAGGIVCPVAVLHPDKRLELFSPAYNDFDTIEYLLCPLRLTDDNNNPVYEFNPVALDTL